MWHANQRKPEIAIAIEATNHPQVSEWTPAGGDKFFDVQPSNFSIARRMVCANRGANRLLANQLFVQPEV